MADEMGVASAVLAESEAAETAAETTTSDAVEGIASQLLAEESQGAGEAENQKAESKQAAEAADYTLEPLKNVFDLTPGCMEKFLDMAKRNGLTRAQAQGALEWLQTQGAAESKEADDKEAARLEQEKTRIIAEWNHQITQDAEFGGQNFKKTMADAGKALRRYDPDGDLSRFLKASGGEFAPPVLRALARVGRDLGEHEFVGRNGGEAARPSLEDRFYPNM